MKNKKVKYIIIAIVVIFIGFFSFLIYKNMFAESNDSRNPDIENYELTNDEKNSIKEKLNTIEEVESIDIHTTALVKSRIIDIVVKLNTDVDFEEFKKIANEIIPSISEKNLAYFDVQIFVDTNTDSEVYPKIGYKFKESNEFSW